MPAVTVPGDGVHHASPSEMRRMVGVTTMRSVSMVQPHQSDRVMATPQSAVASSAQVAAQAQARLAAGLAMIAGYMDAYGYITFKTYVSFISGNTTQTGYLAGQGNC